MRRPAPFSPPVCLTIAGSDSGGGAGIQADLKAMEAAGVFGTTVITAVTAQHTQGVDRSFVLPIEEIRAQLEAVTGDIAVDAVKTGMLATRPVIELVTAFAREADIPLVVDPVMVAASGDRLLDADAEDAYAELIREATVVTPNTDEAAVLTGREITSPADATAAAEALVNTGANAALVKGGHLDGEQVTNVLATTDETCTFHHRRIDSAATHGSGCTLASTIAARIAHGDGLQAAVETALERMNRAVRYPIDIGAGPGTVNHLASIRNDAALPGVINGVREVVTEFVAADVSVLVPEVGMNVVGATPYAEDRRDTAAVEGRITRTATGIRPNLGVARGASSHVARFLLASREFVPTLQYCVNCRFDDDIEVALAELGWETAEYDREHEPDEDAEGQTMQWGAAAAFETAPTTPVAVIDRGAHGKEPIVKLLASDTATLTGRTLTLAETVATIQSV